MPIKCPLMQSVPPSAASPARRSTMHPIACRAITRAFCAMASTRLMLGNSGNSGSFFPPTHQPTFLLLPPPFPLRDQVSSYPCYVSLRRPKGGRLGDTVRSATGTLIAPPLLVSPQTFQTPRLHSITQNPELQNPLASDCLVASRTYTPYEARYCASAPPPQTPLLQLQCYAVPQPQKLFDCNIHTQTDLVLLLPLPISTRSITSNFTQQYCIALATGPTSHVCSLEQALRIQQSPPPTRLLSPSHPTIYPQGYQIKGFDTQRVCD